jgi:hypothetical protein
MDDDMSNTHSFIEKCQNKALLFPFHFPGRKRWWWEAGNEIVLVFL